MTLFAYALLAVSADAPVVQVPQRYAQLRIQQRIMVRVPAAPVRPPIVRVRYRERKGPKCVPMTMLAGAAITQPDAVDLYLRGGARVRAKLEHACPALDYYRGFYLKPMKDGLVCADRDTIHSRMGGKCGIDVFKALVPAK